MSTHEEHIELFDRYLRGRLTHPERESFELRLAGDQAFADDFRVHKILALGIRDHGRQELKAYLKAHGKKLEGGFNPRMRRLSLAMAASVILLVGVLVVVNYYIASPRQADLALKKEEPPAVLPPGLKQDTVYSNFSEAGNQALAEAEGKKMEGQPVTADDKALPPPMMAEREEIPGNVEISPGPVYGYSTTSKSGSAMDMGDITVNTEKKLRDTLMTAELLFDEVVLDDSKSEDKSLSKSADVQIAGVDNASKKSKRYEKSPSASIPGNRVNNNIIEPKILADSTKLAETSETDQKKNADREQFLQLYNNKQSKRSVNVEFWQSPLNFKGYKYTGNTLYLYGVSQDGIKLYIYKDKTYMRTGGQVYLLEPCENGCPFKAAEDKTITEFILKQP